MPRGQQSAVGDVRVAPNGYTYIKVDGRGWVLKHWLVWEEVSKRQVDTQKDMIRFANGDKTDFRPENIVRIEKGAANIRKKLARLYAQRDEVVAQITYYEKQLSEHDSQVIVTS